MIFQGGGGSGPPVPPLDPHLVATLYCNNQSTILSLWKAILKETQKSNNMSLSYSVVLDDRCYPDMRSREYIILNWGLKKKKKKKKKTRFFMFFTLIFGDNFFIIDFSKLCSR